MKFIQGETKYEDYISGRKEYKTYIAKMAIVNFFREKKAKGEEITFADQLRLVSLINVTTLTGKLEGFYAISTNVLMNPCCQARARIDGCICKDCYAAAGVNRFSTLCQALEVNYIILNEFDISEEAWATLDIPSTNGKSRIESHGDTATVTCSMNYVRIVRSHGMLVFGVWGKNVNHYRVAFSREGKPANMIFILSSEFVNVVAEVPEDMVQYVDHVFTVFTLEFAKANKITINCGKYDPDTLEMIDHHCKNCLLCYTYGTTFYINELKK